MLRIVNSQDREVWQAILRRRGQRLSEAERIVAPILAAVRDRGDDALIEYARELDGLAGPPLRLSASQLQAAREALPEPVRRAVSLAASRIRRYAQRQLPTEWMEPDEHGIELGQLVRPLDSVGAYVPGGRYPLPSTVMMTAVPARTAGVARIAMASPRPSAVTVGVAASVGVTEIYAVGGAQAIAAFAFGTESIPRVDRIVGPETTTWLRPRNCWLERPESIS